MENNKDYNHITPDHYKKLGIEVNEMIIKIWGKEAFIKHCQINAFEYRLRAGNKPDQPMQRDIEKAMKYEAIANSLLSENETSIATNKTQ